MIPGVYQAFNDLSGAAMAAGALDTKVKELMAMVIGVVHGCDGCIASHARGAARASAGKEEAAEAIGVAIMMHGGPATIYGARAYQAFCEFADAAGPAVPDGPAAANRSACVVRKRRHHRGVDAGRTEIACAARGSDRSIAAGQDLLEEGGVVGLELLSLSGRSPS